MLDHCRAGLATQHEDLRARDRTPSFLTLTLNSTRQQLETPNRRPDFWGASGKAPKTLQQRARLERASRR